MLKNSASLGGGAIAVWAFVLVSCGRDVPINNVIEYKRTINVQTTDRKVFAFNHSLARAQTNNLFSMQLGQITTAPYGTHRSKILSGIALSTYAPTFGVYTQEVENDADTDSNNRTIKEEETVTEVMLHIPFFADYQRTSNNDIRVGADGRRLYSVDSVFGNKDAAFKMRIQESSYYLNDLNPTQLNRGKEYFSDEDLSAYEGEVLADTDYKVDTGEVLTGIENNLNTEADESRLSPRIRIPLKNEFFQTKIIDQEGTENLLRDDLFRDYLRGVFITAYGLSDDLMMILNMSGAYIDISYSYKWVNESLQVENRTSTFRLLLGVYTVNLFGEDRSAAFPVTSPSDEADRIYLNASQFYTELKFDDSQLQELKNKNWIINGAELTFYIDKSIASSAVDPERIYIFNLARSVPIEDYTAGIPTNRTITSLKGEFLSYGGQAIREDSKGIYYSIQITRYLQEILGEDNPNPRLGLVLSANNFQSPNSIVSLDTEGNRVRLPRYMASNPLGTVFYGSSDQVPEDKRVKLKIYYTDLNEI